MLQPPSLLCHHLFSPHPGSGREAQLQVGNRQGFPPVAVTCLNSGFGFLLQPFWQRSPSTAPEVRHVRRDSSLSTGFPVHDQPQPRLWLWLCPALVSSLSELLKCQSSPHPPSGPVLQAPCAALNGSSSPGFLWLCTERLPGHALGFLLYFMAFGGSSAEELWNSYPPCLGENSNWKI